MQRLKGYCKGWCIILNVRERTELWENEKLSAFACASSKSKGRKRAENECDMRTCFQRDRDRIIHCKSFRRLKHKTQVFLSPEGDHYRTRLTHTLEVSQIARTIARALALNEDLTEAIALGHDLGHTPFGHAGEQVLNQISACGFKHFEQSARVVELLEKNGDGLNLTAEVVDGIKKHTRGAWPDTLEGCVVRYADRIAYINHDIDDAIRAGVLKNEEIPKHIIDVLGDTKSKRINTLVFSLVENSCNGKLGMNDEVKNAYDEIHDFMYEFVYLSPKSKKEENKIPDLICKLYDYYKKFPYKLEPFYQGVADKEGLDRAVCDYIAGMTDHYAIQMYCNLFVPKGWQL